MQADSGTSFEAIAHAAGRDRRRPADGRPHATITNIALPAIQTDHDQPPEAASSLYRGLAAKDFTLVPKAGEALLIPLAAPPREPRSTCRRAAGPLGPLGPLP